MSPESESRTVSAPLIVVACLGVLLGHSALVFVMYRARVLHHSALAESDALTFGAPFLLAAAAYSFLLRLLFSARQSRSHTVSIAAAGLFAALVSSVVALIVAFNTFGT